MLGQWIQKPKSGTSIIFVHGILSDGEACWRNPNGNYWPTLLKDETEFDALGIYVYTYQTGIFSGSYRLGDVVDDLKERMTLDGLLESQKIIFVCHSMGGIVVRKFLIERDADLIERKIEIGLFLVASPSLGSAYASWLGPLAQVLGHAQADALRFSSGNAWLNDLDKEFQNVKGAGKLRVRGKELIEDKFVVLKKFFRKQVVDPISGARYFGEAYKVPQSDHFSIAKPENNEAIQHRLLLQFIRDMLVSVRAASNNLIDPENRPPIAPTREFFIGRWQVEQSLGMAKNATFIDYFENGSFSGEEQAFDTEGVGRRVLTEGRWSLTQLSQDKFRLTLDAINGGYWHGTQWNGNFKVIDHDRIHNIDQNYDAVRTLR